MIMSINRTLLAAFHSVASAGSFTVAARERNISQSTLSVQVGCLEKAYGCRLFQRRGRSIELTEIGRALHSITSRQFEAEQEAETLLRGDQAGLTGHLRIGAVSSVLVVRYLESFLKTYPQSTCALELSNSQRVIREITDGNLDIGIVAFPISDPRIEKVELLCEELLVVVGPDHDWATQNDIAFGNLAGQTLILRERGSRTRQLIEDKLATLQVSPSRVIEINEWAAVQELVRAKTGVSIVPSSEAGSMPGLRTLRIRDQSIQLTQFLIYRGDRKTLSTLKTFLEIAAPSERRDPDRSGQVVDSQIALGYAFAHRCVQ